MAFSCEGCAVSYVVLGTEEQPLCFLVFFLEQINRRQYRWPPMKDSIASRQVPVAKNLLVSLINTLASKE